MNLQKDIKKFIGKKKKKRNRNRNRNSDEKKEIETKKVQDRY